MTTVKVINEIRQAPKGSIFDRVKTVEDAFKEIGVAPGQGFEINCTAQPLECLLSPLAAYAMLFVLAKALNEGVELSYKNTDQKKWYPVFQFVPGSGFSLHGVHCVRTGTHVGAALCFKDRATAEYAGKQFIELYERAIEIYQPNLAGCSVGQK